ncbi:MAG: TIGR04086 family membrane protein [Desulfotomaculales bacterium]
MAEAKEPTKLPGINWVAVGKGTLASTVLALTLTFTAGFIFYGTRITESIMPWVTAFVLFFSVVLGGAIAAYSAGGRGLYHGAAVGVTFFLLLWLTAALVFPGPITAGDIAEKFFLSLSAGAVGGILGVMLAV